MKGTIMVGQLRDFGLISFVDAARIQCVETAYPVALTLFSGLVRPTRIVVQATNRGMTQELMPWKPEVLCNWRSFKSLVFPVISVTIHPQAGFPRQVTVSKL